LCGVVGRRVNEVAWWPFRLIFNRYLIPERCVVDVESIVADYRACCRELKTESFSPAVSCFGSFNVVVGAELPGGLLEPAQHDRLSLISCFEPIYN